MNPDECDHPSTKEIAYREWEGSLETLKEAINSFLWIHANPDWTLRKCEEVACKIHSLLLK